MKDVFFPAATHEVELELGQRLQFSRCAPQYLAEVVISRGKFGTVLVKLIITKNYWGETPGKQYAFRKEARVCWKEVSVKSPSCIFTFGHPELNGTITVFAHAQFDGEGLTLTKVKVLDAIWVEPI